MKRLAIAMAITFFCVAGDTTQAQLFSNRTKMYFEPRGVPVRASFRVLSPESGELRWKSTPGHAYIIEEGHLSENRWDTFATVIAASGEHTEQVIPLEPGSHFFKVSSAPTYVAGDFASIDFHFEPYIPGWKLEACGAEWRWSNGYVVGMSANYRPWRGLYSNAGPLLLTLTVTAPDSSSITGKWAMTITNATLVTRSSAAVSFRKR